MAADKIDRLMAHHTRDAAARQVARIKVDRPTYATVVVSDRVRSLTERAA